MGLRRRSIQMTTSIHTDQHELAPGEATRGVDPWICIACRRLGVGSSVRAGSLSALFVIYASKGLGKASGRVSGQDRASNNSMYVQGVPTTSSRPVTTTVILQDHLVSQHRTQLLLQHVRLACDVDTSLAVRTAGKVMRTLGVQTAAVVKWRWHPASTYGSL